METIQSTGASIPAALAVTIAMAVVLVIAVVAVLWRLAGANWRAGEEATARAHELESHIGTLLTAQSEMAGRMQAMSELLGNRQAELSKSLSERLDGMTHRLNQSMGDATKNDARQPEKACTSGSRCSIPLRRTSPTLAGQVTTLSNILANKQTRGAFGQGRMEAIVSDNLPRGSYEFQYTLKSTGGRPDCVIHLPNDAPPLVVDAKFPLEAVQRTESGRELRRRLRPRRRNSATT